MEEKKQTCRERLLNVIYGTEMKDVRLGMEISTLKDSYYYSDVIAFLKGTATGNEDMYFGKLKPLYDEYGYEKVNRILLDLDALEQGGKENE